MCNIFLKFAYPKCQTTIPRLCCLVYLWLCTGIVTLTFRPVTERRKTYDGREITMVTLDTQTDWDWVEKAEVWEARAPSEGSML